MTLIGVPEMFAADTVAREGEAARPWLARLPELVDDTVNEAAALALWNGGGAVRLFDADSAAGALLLEWLDPQRSLAEADLSVAVRTAGRLLQRLAVPVPEPWPARQVPGLRQWALGLAADLPGRWRAAGQPFSEHRLDTAADVATALAARPEGLLTNRDMHYGSVLAGEREPWLVIDPKAMRGDAEFGLAPLLWRRLEEAGGPAGLRRRFDVLVAEAGLDAQLARDWTLLRVVDYQLWGLSIGLTGDPVLCETVIDWLALAGGR